jgi:hypothetical protein
MFSCPYCQSQLTEPLPSRCPACGGDLQALGAPSPPPAVPEGSPADTAEASEPWRSGQGADAPPHVGGFQPPPLPPPGPGAPGGTSGGARFVWDDRDRVGLGQAFLET